MTSSILILLIVTLGWPESYCQTVPPVTDGVVCQPHILKQCQSLNYSTTLPNLRGQTDPDDIENEFLQFEILFRYNCSNALLVLLCSIYAPFCGFDSTSNSSVVLKPCQNLCNHVYDGCIGVFNEFQYQWPEILNCEKFPQYGKEVCFGTLKPGDIEYPTLIDSDSTIPLPTTPDYVTLSPSSTDDTIPPQRMAPMYSSETNNTNTSASSLSKDINSGQL